MEETIEYKGSEYYLNKNHLCDYIFLLIDNSLELKNYQAKWKIENGRLNLIHFAFSNFKFSDLFEASAPQLALWFTGSLSFKISEGIDYDICLVLIVSNGQISDRKITKVFASDFPINFGKYKDRKFSDLLFNKDLSYLKWAIKNVDKFCIPPHILNNINIGEEIKTTNMIKFLGKYQVTYNINTFIYEYNIPNIELYRRYVYYLDDDFNEDYYEELENDQKDEYNYEKDYFDTMTNGQFGNYEDFGGNLDDIDAWSRG